MSLILAGKVGSNIASEIGTVRVTEQIDALDIMGINSANFIVLPKIIGFVLFVPVLCILSMLRRACRRMVHSRVHHYDFHRELHFRHTIVLQ